MPLELAQVVVAVFEAYALTGTGFALMFLPRAVARLDPRVAAAPKTLRLLILPGIVALWPVFARRWITGAHEPIENNSHRARVRASLPVAGGS